jgi:hypothetical protein
MDLYVPRQELPDHHVYEAHKQEVALNLWAIADYVVTIYVEIDPCYALPALAHAIFDHVDRVALPVNSISFGVCRRGAVATILYDGRFHAHYSQERYFKELDPDLIKQVESIAG